MRKAMRWRRADEARTAAIGMSAGAALAAILGVRHGDSVRAVVSVAGIACGAAASPLTALTVMKRGPETDVAAVGREAGDGARSVPLLAIHGRSDDVVAPRNAAALVRQFLARNGVDVPKGSESTLPDPDHARRESPLRGHGFALREWQCGDALAARLVEIDDVGHAWSGGDASLPFNDAAGPDATAMAGAFLELVWARAPA
jgi:poly(3-hydroxybutyrate) depolymerase